MNESSLPPGTDNPFSQGLLDLTLLTEEMTKNRRDAVKFVESARRLLKIWVRKSRRFPVHGWIF